MIRTGQKKHRRQEGQDCRCGKGRQSYGLSLLKEKDEKTKQRTWSIHKTVPVATEKMALVAIQHTVYKQR